MSVYFFGADELGNVAAVIARADTWGDKIERTTKALALISTANAACFRWRYSHKGDDTVEAWSAKAIERAARAAAPGDLEAARGTVGLLHYNCQEDRDFLAEIDGGLTALIEILEGVVYAHTRVSEARHG